MMIKTAVMQPYFIPYIGYFQLINLVDKFVVYDNIEFTKKGWINRNRILVNGKDEYLSLPIKKDSDFLPVCERYLADSFEDDKKKCLRKVAESYRKSPHYSTVFPIIEEIFNYKSTNLFDFIQNSIKLICNYLEIKTEFIVSSSLNINHSLRAEEKVIAICENLNTSTYINPIGGLDLYSRETFKNQNIELKFLKTGSFRYKQHTENFIEFLSIVDVIMFNSLSETKQMLTLYTLQ